MIAALSGEILSMSLDSVVLDCSGVGYRVYVTPDTVANCAVGKKQSLLTTLIVREDSLTLYGFTNSDAQELFSLVQTVSGIGPRLALATLAVLPPDQLISALHNSDARALCTVPGIGKRVAERLIVDLRDKVAVYAPMVTSSEAKKNSALVHVVEALVGLGFTEKNSELAVEEILAEQTGDEQTGNEMAESFDTAQVLRLALARLGKST